MICARARMGIRFIAGLLSVSCISAFAETRSAVDANAAQGQSQDAQKQKTPMEIADDLLKLRDPFKRIIGATGPSEIKSVLERFASTSFKLVGVQTGPGKGRAVLVDSEGTTHIVGERTRIGLNNGYIAKIYRDRILVKERVHNILGQIEEISTSIELQPESKYFAKPGQDGASQVTEVIGRGGGAGAGGMPSLQNVAPQMTNNPQGVPTMPNMPNMEHGLTPNPGVPPVQQNGMNTQPVRPGM